MTTALDGSNQYYAPENSDPRYGYQRVREDDVPPGYQVFAYNAGTKQWGEGVSDRVQEIDPTQQDSYFKSKANPYPSLQELDKREMEKRGHAQTRKRTEAMSKTVRPTEESTLFRTTTTVTSQTSEKENKYRHTGLFGRRSSDEGNESSKRTQPSQLCIPLGTNAFSSMKSNSDSCVIRTLNPDFCER